MQCNIQTVKHVLSTLFGWNNRRLDFQLPGSGKPVGFLHCCPGVKTLGLPRKKKPTSGWSRLDSNRGGGPDCYSDHTLVEATCNNKLVA